MASVEKIDIDIFKVVNRAIAQSDDLEIMAHQLTQLMVGTLGIKGCTVFALNPATDELEPLASFGLSIGYLNKGPVLTAKSIAGTKRGEPVVIRDISTTDLLQYPEEARAEGIAAILSVPIKFSGRVIGALRLYHHEVWDIPAGELDALLVLGENIGLAMTYSRLVNALREVRRAAGEVHDVWLNPSKS
jgi:GAF domain-containing protein